MELGPSPVVALKSENHESQPSLTSIDSYSQGKSQHGFENKSDDSCPSGRGIYLILYLGFILCDVPITKLGNYNLCIQ